MLGVKKKNGEYEPSSIRVLAKCRPISSEKKDTNFSFWTTKNPQKEAKQLKAFGKGNKLNRADALTDEEIEEFYRVGVLGNNTPRALLSTVRINNCVYFGRHEIGQEQRDLCWGDLGLKTNSDRLCYVKVSTASTKTRLGGYPKNVRESRPKMFENLNTRLLLILLYLAFSTFLSLLFILTLLYSNLEVEK